MKNSVQSVVENHQKRILVLSLDHGGELVYKGDNMSFANLSDDGAALESMKRILTDVQSDSETSYNFDNHQLAYAETNRAGQFRLPY